MKTRGAILLKVLAVLFVNPGKIVCAF